MTVASEPVASALRIARTRKAFELAAWGRAAVEIAAAVRADELRFECKPRVRVVAYSDSPASAESVSEREHMPDVLKPGVTQRDFAVRWHVAAGLGDPEPP
jgi:hypothetical protein